MKLAVALCSLVAVQLVHVQLVEAQVSKCDVCYRLLWVLY